MWVWASRKPRTRAVGLDPFSGVPVTFVVISGQAVHPVAPLSDQRPSVAAGRLVLQELAAVRVRVDVGCGGGRLVGTERVAPDEARTGEREDDERRREARRGPGAGHCRRSMAARRLRQTDSDSPTGTRT